MKISSHRTGEPSPDELDELQEWRSKRFRILVCVDGSEESYEGLRFAADIGSSDECDIILCYVRPIDQGLRTGGLQVRVARENLLEWGLELPGVRYLKKGFEILLNEEKMVFQLLHSHFIMPNNVHMTTLMCRINLYTFKNLNS